MSRVLVRNLPKHLTEARLREHFSKVGEVTDAKIAHTKDGRSRLFGFVGFRAPDVAQRAVSHFNRTFVDTSRVSVEMAKPVGDPSLARPWSRYSKGSSKYLQQHPETKTTTVAKTTTRKRTKSEDGPGKEDEDLKRFLKAMKTGSGGGKKHSWSNEDAGLPGEAVESGEPDRKKRRAKEDVTVDVSETTQVVESKKRGGKGTFLKRTHLKFGDADPEDERGETKTDDQVGKVVGVTKTTPSYEQYDDSDSDDDEDSHRLPSSPPPTVPTPSGGDKDKDSEWEEGRLFVRNLSYSCTEKDLVTLFKSYGPVSEVHVPLDPSTKRPKGFAFVLFMVPSDALKAFSSLDGSPFQGRLLHILPARSAPAPKDSEISDKSTSSSTFKGKKQEEMVKHAQSPFNWNSLFLRQDTVASAMSESLDVEKRDLLERDSSNLAVRMALSEAHVVAETKRALEKQGVRVGELESVKQSTERSQTIILVKNIPADASREELLEMFQKFGEVERMALPPSNAIAVVEMAHPTEARSAFKQLAYRKYRHVPLFLEWAPVGTFAPKEEEKEEEEEEEEETAQEETKEEKAQEETKEEEQGRTASVFVKNVNFETVEDGVRQAFAEKGCGVGIRKVTIPRKRGMNKDGRPQKLSMGFAFVEFGTPEEAVEAVKRVQGFVLDGHSLQLSLSRSSSSGAGDEESSQARASKKRDARAREAQAQPKSTKLVVRNVPFETTRKELRDIFAPFAQVKSVRLPKRFDGRPRGFAFIEFLTPQEAAAAMEAVKAVHLYGRHLVVEYASTEESPVT